MRIPSPKDAACVPKIRSASSWENAPPDNNIQEWAAFLASMKLADIRARWLAHFGSPPPLNLNRHWLRRLFLYRLQEAIFGTLAPSTTAQLEEIATNVKSIGSYISSRREILSCGTLLKREYEGVHYSIVVTENGYLWNDQEFSNLNQIARAITGLDVNGRHFFGLRTKYD
jgi:hypothetical protein